MPAIWAELVLAHFQRLQTRNAAQDFGSVSPAQSAFHYYNSLVKTVPAEYENRLRKSVTFTASSRDLSEANVVQFCDILTQAAKWNEAYTYNLSRAS
ncbi:hypothetical protein J6590_085034 [Homalodisca vitripennis]|nr:hypothetical protein J6590_085034 [Homalodisca vitripennis]